MPWLKYIEVIINGKRKTTKEDLLTIKLKKGQNTIEVVSINHAGRRGKKSEFVICFDNKYPSVKSYW
ncbi:MAG: hypothetical protein HON90_07945 [Halobacteriovoraceae bacterium]|nr:hypothetical protein [Halobacteriovoraceae bacterium]